MSKILSKFVYSLFLCIGFAFSISNVKAQLNSSSNSSKLPVTVTVTADGITTIDEEAEDIEDEVYHSKYVTILDLQLPQFIKIKYISGTVNLGKYGDFQPKDGYVVGGSSDYAPHPSKNLGNIICVWVKPDGSLFPVEDDIGRGDVVENPSFSIGQNLKLGLYVNDEYYNDNSGSYTVEISIAKLSDAREGSLTHNRMQAQLEGRLINPNQTNTPKIENTIKPQNTNPIITSTNQNTTVNKPITANMLTDTFWVGPGFMSLTFDKNGNVEMKDPIKKEDFTATYSIVFGMLSVKFNHAEIVGKIVENNLELFIRYTDGKVRKDSSGKSYTQENISMRKFMDKGVAVNSQSNKNTETKQATKLPDSYLNSGKNPTSNNTQTKQSVDLSEPALPEKYLEYYLTLNNENKRKFSLALDAVSLFSKQSYEATSVDELVNFTLTAEESLDAIFNAASDVRIKGIFNFKIEKFNELGYLILDFKNKIDYQNSAETGRLTELKKNYIYRNFKTTEDTKNSRSFLLYELENYKKMLKEDEKKKKK